MRELNVSNGDTIMLDKLPEMLVYNEKRLQSMGLFTLADLNIKDWDLTTNQANIEINVREIWFVYPYLILEFADRNFNVWRKEFNYSIDRINYGLALNHINLTGHKDKLKIKFQQGYTHKYELAYDYPYIHQNWGLAANISDIENKEISYKTFDNKPLFYKHLDERKLFQQRRVTLSLLNRTNALTFQKLTLDYVNIKIDSVIAQLNPNFLLDERTKINYFALEYEIKYDKTIYPFYPIGGYRLDVNLRKEGLGIFQNVNNLSVSFGAEKHININRKLILSSRIKYKQNLLKNNLAYYFNKAIGFYKDNVTGYQLFVLDGKSYFLMKSTIKYPVFEHNFKLKKFMPKAFKDINTKLFFRFNFDVGYASDPIYGAENPLTNHTQYGYGPAIDLILINNIILTAELGITKQGQKGLFFSSGLNF